MRSENMGVGYRRRRNRGVRSLLKLWHHSLTLNLLPSGTDTSQQDRVWVFIQKKPKAGLYSQNPSTRQGASIWMSFLCGVLRKESAWETRSQSCIISFLGLGQETRTTSPEGTLIRSRKQHKELSFSPTGKSTQLLKPVTSSEAFTFPNGPHVHLHSANTKRLQAPACTRGMPTSFFLSNQIPHLRLGSGRVSYTKLLRWTHP